jgi:hypothetical protein
VDRFNAHLVFLYRPLTRACYCDSHNGWIQSCPFHLTRKARFEIEQQPPLTKLGYAEYRGGAIAGDCRARRIHIDRIRPQHLWHPIYQQPDALHTTVHDHHSRRAGVFRSSRRQPWGEINHGQHVAAQVDHAFNICLGVGNAHDLLNTITRHGVVTAPNA